LASRSGLWGNTKLAITTYQAHTRTFARILSLLDNLKSTAAGSTLYKHIEQSFFELENSQLNSEKLYLNLLDKLLNNLAVHFPAGAEQWMQIQIMQKSLQDSMTESELHDIQSQVQQLLEQAQKDNGLGQKSMQETINSLLGDEIGLGELNTPSPNLEHSDQTASAEHTPTKLNQQVIDVDNSEATAYPEAPFCNIDQARDNINNIQSSLADQINNAKQFNSALSKLLHNSFSVIRNLDETDNISQVKNTFLRRYAKLIKMQQDLAGNFQSLDDGLNDIVSSSHNLNEELSRVHRLSLTDELTQLPNRRAFLMRLDDEISRALRFDYPLAMALIDIDNFKPINDTYGHAAGDVILQHFAQNMNIVFRYHDMATRYGGEEFAVLFPNTDIHGALSALNKLQHKLKVDPYILVKDTEIPVPTFSAGITLYNQGEDSDELIRRSDVAMYKAKTAGRDLIEVDPLGVKQSQERNKTDMPA